MSSAGVAYLDESDGDETGTTESANWFSNEPFAVGLCDDRNSVAGFGIELVSTLCYEIVKDDGEVDWDFGRRW